MNPMRLPKDRVDALDPAPIEDYLRSQGWQERAVPIPRAAVYRHPGFPEEEILLPRDKGFVDYALRVGEVLVTLGTVEKRTAWELLEEFSARQGLPSRNGASRVPEAEVQREVS